MLLEGSNRFKVKVIARTTRVQMKAHFTNAITGDGNALGLDSVKED